MSYKVPIILSDIINSGKVTLKRMALDQFSLWTRIAPFNFKRRFNRCFFFSDWNQLFSQSNVCRSFSRTSYKETIILSDIVASRKACLPTLTPIQLPNPKRNGRKERKSLFVPLFSVGFTPMIIRSQSAEIKKTSAKKLLVLTDSEIKFFIKLFFSSLLKISQSVFPRQAFSG